MLSLDLGAELAHRLGDLRSEVVRVRLALRLELLRALL